MPRAIALPELDASACMSFARACIKAWLMRLCALLCLRTQDLQHILFNCGAGVAAVTNPRSLDPRGSRFMHPLFSAGGSFVWMRTGWRQLLCFRYCELVFYSVKVILGPARMYASGCVYLMRSELLSTRVRRSLSVSVWICVIQRVSSGATFGLPRPLCRFKPELQFVILLLWVCP